MLSGGILSFVSYCGPDVALGFGARLDVAVLLIVVAAVPAGDRGAELLEGPATSSYFIPPPMCVAEPVGSHTPCRDRLPRGRSA